MSRTATRRRNNYKPGLLTRYLPESMQVFMARRAVDVTGAALLLFGVFTLFALLSFHTDDPSGNTASGSEEIHNWMGASGAWWSDCLLQYFGLGGFMFAAAGMIWGLRLFRRIEMPPLWLRFSVFVFALLMLSLACSILPAFIWSDSLITLGGSVGIVLLNGFSGLLTPLLHFSAHIPVALIALVGAVFLMPMAMGFRLGDGVSLMSGLAFAGSWIAAQSLELWQRTMAWIRHYDRRAEKPPVVKVEKPAPPRRTPTLKETETPFETRRDIAVVTPGSNETQGKKPAKSTKQTQLALGDGSEWTLPSPDLLQDPPEQDNSALIDRDLLRRNAEELQAVLADFNIQGEITSIHPGPVVTLYELEPAPGVKTARVISLCDDIARSMSAVSVRAAVVPGRSVIGIELPNKKRQTVFMREMLGHGLVEKSKSKLPLLLGKDIGGQPVVTDLTRMPHVLVAGTTGSGKSVAINTMLLSLVYHLPPEKCRLILIDPKMLELSVYDDIPHLLSPVVTEPGKAVVALKWAVKEMEDRYRAMSQLGVRNIDGYNARLAEARKTGEILMRKVQTGFDPDTGKPIYEEITLDLTELPYIVVVVDEFADLMLVAGKDVENAIQRLAQMARAAGIHIIMATQRPSVDVITGVVKANFPTRISFAVTSKIDSRTILGEGGAEQLLGMGDMLYMSAGGRIQRVHGPFVSDEDVEGVVKFLKSQGAPNYVDDVTSETDFGDNDVMAAMFGDGEGGSGDDELYDQAVAIVAREGKASTSFIQRHLQIGYNRAARIIEEMERQGVVSPATKTGKREVLVGGH